ncbi:PRTRC system protein E [Mongoliitalea daihaiensis]|uniref:PRTRC system protein E n=1 Tax=Mongoliitalea daihaiensis TaxID=2782006 RepID=UPI001F17709F|nr:PRTRC system protein E [Mongoliitalea daihaiensis]UJP64042.1 PRTRC system protein E [Mongoliitalea daihaiensis]
MFKALHSIMGKATISLTIVKTADNELTVSIVPKSEGTSIVPAIISGTPEELDACFADSISGLVQDTENLILKKDAASKSIKEESKQSVAKKSTAKEAKKEEAPKSEPKKVEAKSEEPKTEQKPVEDKVQEAPVTKQEPAQIDIFDDIFA